MSDVWGAPVTANLLTGFLGAGKTSLLKRLLRQPELSDTAVLINEFGEVGLDHLLVEEVDEDLVLLKSGCVCCTIRGDLKEALARLHGRRQRGEVPAFSRVVIETTGLADPAPIVATLATDPMLRHHFRLGNVVTVVDGLSGERNLKDFPEAARQAAAADRVVLSKIDLAEARAVDRLHRRLAALNPAAQIMEADEETEAEALLLTQDMGAHGASLAEAERWMEAGEAHAHHPDRSRHGDIRSFVIEREAPVDWLAFGLWLSMLLNRHGERILRLKGLVRVDGQAGPVAVQGVQHLVHKPVHLERWPGDDRRTRLVVIGKDLDPELVRRSFEAFVG
ncbi:MAG: GTP-binding protein [Parvibaculaceae bacterium]